MRILMVTQPTDGGVYQHVSELAGALVERGDEVAVCGPLAGRVVAPGVATLPAPLVRAVDPLADARATAALARQVRRYRPDVIHAHSSKAGAVARAARAASPRTPVVYTPHGYAFAGYFTSERARGAYRLVERALAPLASIVLCVCEHERRLAASVGPERRTRVVHNGVKPVPEGPPHPLIERLRQRGPVVGVLSLLRPGKGLETLIDAAPAIVREHPGVQIVVAGEGPDRAELERRIMARGVTADVHLIGATAGPAPLLRGCDVFCSPSWAESFPLSLLEAMSAALPVVATAVGGCGEAVDDGRSGILVPPRDPDALARGLSRLVADRELGARLGDAGRARVLEGFTFDRMVEGTAQVYAGCAH